MFCIASSAQAASTELISNGSFENDETGWYCGYDNYCSIFSRDDGVGSAKSGSKWAYVTPSSSEFDGFEVLEQTIQVPVGTKSLELSFWYQFYLEEDESLNDGFFGVSLDKTDDSGDSYFDEFFGDSEETSSWKQYTATINNSSLAGKEITLSFYTSEDWPWSTSGDVDAISLMAHDEYVMTQPKGLWANQWSDIPKLTWNAVDAAQFYKVQLRTQSGRLVKKWKQVTKTTKKTGEGMVVAGKKYQFRVKACNTESNCGAWSKYKKFTAL